jgi:hypothetical protein
MTCSPTHKPAPDADRMSRFPALAKLSLSEADLAELAHQGSLAPERRGSRTYYKLRFRRGGRQLVRYVGGADQAALVSEELSALQTTRRLERQLNEVGRAARQLQRDAKAKLEPLLAECGFRFHGQAIRRSRRSHQQITSVFPPNHDQEVNNESTS